MRMRVRTSGGDELLEVGYELAADGPVACLTLE